MEQIASTIGVLCVCVFVTGILYNVGCFKVTDKTIRFVIAMYIIVITFKFAIKFRIDEFEFVLPKLDIEQNATDIAIQMIVEKTQQEVENKIKNRLEDKNISYNYVYVHILEENNNLTIGQIQIGCPQTQKSQVEENIKDLVDKDTVVVIGE